MKELTKAEEQIMHVLWDMKKAFVKDIILKLPDPKPAYNTVSTIVRILETKGFIGHKAYGKTYEYYPLVEKDKYKSYFLKSFIGSYFGGSFENLVSFFAKDNKLDIKDLDEIMKQLQNKKENGDTQ
jgi:BlaI family transcriptional regulator, penicillinase repressor